MADEDFYDEIEEWYQPAQYQPDQYFLNAKEDLESLFNTDKNKVFYIRQLQVMFEKKYFHWVTYNAIESLLNEGFIRSISESTPSFGTPIHFLVHHSNRYPKRLINELSKIVEAYSNDTITLSCGHRAEDLFALVLSTHGFMPASKKVKEYNGIKWTKTDNDLDYIFITENSSYGCEIKNTLGYIEKEVLEIKLEMCRFLKVKPLFILRFAPKTYIEMIRQAGGYAMIFECQIYELSQIELVKTIKSKLGLPVDCPKAIPEGIIIRFEKWHNKQA